MPNICSIFLPCKICTFSIFSGKTGIFSYIILNIEITHVRVKMSLEDRYEIIRLDTDTFPYFEQLLPDLDLTEESGDFYFLGVLDDTSLPCGVLWYEWLKGAYEIRYIAVHPAFRRRGIGTFLIRSFLRSLYGMGMVFPVMISFSKEDAPDYFPEFLDSLGFFSCTKEGTAYSIRKKDLLNSAFYQKISETKDHTVSFFSLAEKEQQEFLDSQREKDLHFADEIIRDSFLCNEKLCRAYVASGEIRSVIFVSRDESDNWEVSYLYCEEADGIALYQVLASVLKKAADMPNLRTIEMNIVEEKAEKILQSFFRDEITGTDLMTAEWNYSI